MFSSGEFDRVSLKDKIIGISIIALPLAFLFILAVIFLRPIPITPAAVVGCYQSEGSPSLDLQSGAIQISEPQRRSFNYIVEPAKIGYRLTVTPALALEPVDGGTYVFRAQRGEGYFWPLLVASSDDPGRMREPKDYGGRFQVTATNGASIVYHRVRGSRVCT